MAKHTITRAELQQALLKIAGQDLRDARESAEHNNPHSLVDTKVGRVDIWYSSSTRTYTLQTARWEGSKHVVETLAKDVPARKAKSALAEVYQVDLQDTKVVG